MNKPNTQQSNTAKKQAGNLGHMAGYYDLVMFFITMGRETSLRHKTLDLAQIKPGEKILEIGCGTGTLSLAARKRLGKSGEVMGIDIAPEMVAVAARKAARHGVNASFQVGGIDKIPFPDNRFDVVMCSFMIFHMPEEIRKAGLREIYRVLKSGGRLFIIDTVDLRGLEPILKEDLFSEIEIDQFKLNFMSVSFLLAAAVKK
jgi:ubiquinone/menaquinone biosynthesis C-methylase UbiE